jgi:hypothetical protein
MGVGKSTSAQAGAHDGQEDRLGVGRILEMVGKVGVKSDAIAFGKLMALSVTDEHDGPSLD